MSANRKWLVILFALLGLVPVANDVHAIIGRPAILAAASIASSRPPRSSTILRPWAWRPE